MYKCTPLVGEQIHIDWVGWIHTNTGTRRPNRNQDNAFANAIPNFVFLLFSLVYLCVCVCFGVLFFRHNSISIVAVCAHVVRAIVLLSKRLWLLHICAQQHRRRHIIFDALQDFDRKQTNHAYVCITIQHNTEMTDVFRGVTSPSIW